LGTLPQASVRLQKLRVPPDDLVEVRAADLLFSLDDPGDAARKLACLLAECSNHREPDRELALVVRSAAREELPVAQGRLGRRRLPKLERLDWLNVVVVAEQKRVVTRASLLAVDSGRPPSVRSGRCRIPSSTRS
jgi:hypothetical protein